MFKGWDGVEGIRGSSPPLAPAHLRCGGPAVVAQSGQSQPSAPGQDLRPHGALDPTSRCTTGKTEAQRGPGSEGAQGRTRRPRMCQNQSPGRSMRVAPPVPGASQRAGRGPGHELRWDPRRGGAWGFPVQAGFAPLAKTAGVLSLSCGGGGSSLPDLLATFISKRSPKPSGCDSGLGTVRTWTWATMGEFWLLGDRLKEVVVAF